MRWFTSDPHYWHKKVIEFCSRPFASLDEMHEELIRRWNARVRPEDTVYVLGDVVFGGVEKGQLVIPRLVGRKIVIVGNHDHKPEKMLRLGFDEARVYDEIEIRGLKFKLSHYPYPPKDGTEDQRFFDRRPVDDGTWLLHGHVHQHWKVRRNMINVGVDVWDFAPVSEDEIFETASGALSL